MTFSGFPLDRGGCLRADTSASAIHRILNGIYNDPFRDPRQARTEFSYECIELNPTNSHTDLRRITIAGCARDAFHFHGSKCCHRSLEDFLAYARYQVVCHATACSFFAMCRLQCPKHHTHRRNEMVVLFGSGISRGIDSCLFHPLRCLCSTT